MKTSLTILLLVACGALASAQVPAGKKAPAPVKKTAAAEPAPAPKPVAAPKPAAKPVEEAEESVVMIDSKADAEPEEGGRYSAGSFGGEQDEPAVPGGLPSSYGQCKGVITEAGRSVLVFESLDDGAISLVQLVLGKGKASWKLLDRIPRSND